MAEVALIILGRMREEARPIIQVCGPISTGGLGSVEANSARFWRSVEVASQHEMLVFNQMPFQEAMIRLDKQRGQVGYCTDILDIFYTRIFQSGHIEEGLFLPDWEGSVGARWEREIMKRFGIRITEYPTEWLIEATKTAE